MRVTQAERELGLEVFRERKRAFHQRRALGSRERAPEDIQDYSEEEARQMEVLFNTAVAAVITGHDLEQLLLSLASGEPARRMSELLGWDSELEAIAMGEQSPPRGSSSPRERNLLTDGNR